MTHRLTLAGLAVVLAWVTLERPYANGPPIRSDGLGYHLWTYALLNGDPNFARYRERYAEADCFIPSDPARGFWHNKYAPGVALVRLPVMALLADRAADVPAITPAEHWAVLGFGAGLLLLTAAVGLRTCRRLGLPDWAGAVAVLGLTFGTGLFHFSTYDAGFSHVYSAAGLAVLLDLGVAAVLGRHRLHPSVAAVVVLLVLIRNTNVLAIGVLTLGYAGWRWQRGDGLPCRDILLVVATGAAGCGGQLALNAHAHGRVVLSSYGGERFLLDRPMLLSVLGSYRKGLFIYYPVLLVVLAGGLADRRTRAATLGFASLVIVFAGIYGCWHSWWLGGGFGHRGFVELVPVAVPVFAATLAHAGRGRRAVLLAMAGVGVATTLRLMAGYWRGDLPFETVTRERFWVVLLGG